MTKKNIYGVYGAHIKQYFVDLMSLVAPYILQNTFQT
jgi:hypothetical protein